MQPIIYAMLSLKLTVEFIFIFIMQSETSNPESTDHTQKELWNNSYPWSKCIWEVTYLSFTLLLWGKLIYATLQYHSGPLPVVIGFIIAQFLVDFVSGLLHWAADTWGKFETPIFGPTIIRAFRMHHVDPQDITLHSFIQTNASTSYPMPPVLVFGLWITCDNFISQTYNWTMIFGVVLGILTNEFHKWAHMVHSKPHPAIVFLQKSGLIISFDKHARHHQGNFDTNYCIINGWMNPILESINFWRRLQNLITYLTGSIPREDDAYWRDLKKQ